MLRPISLVFSVALVVTPLVLAVLAGAPDGLISDARAQYASDGQYGSAPQYDAAEGSAQPGVAPGNDQSGVAPSCAQDALNSLGGSGPNKNAKLLVQYIKCGGTIASLPQNVFDTLKAQNILITRFINGVSYACPNGGDQAYCSAV